MSGKMVVQAGTWPNKQKNTHIHVHTNIEKCGIQSTMPKSNLHKSNNRLSRRSIPVLFSLGLYFVVFNPS